MKVKSLLTALAIPMAFAACSNEEFVITEQGNNETYVADGKIYLSDDFMLVGGRNQGVDTRSAWKTGNGTAFYWIPKKNSDNSDLLDFSSVDWADYSKDAIGLCYVTGNKILTNYKFDHDGWVEWGQKLANTPYLCTDGQKGYTRNYLRFAQLEKTTASKISNIENETVNGLPVVKGTLDAAKSSAIESYDDQNYKIQDLNLGRGIFKTCEKTIFEGNYIAYAPWNSAMLKAGNLTAISPVEMQYEGGDYANRISDLNKYTFSCGWVGKIDGGTEAGEMIMQTLSKLLSLKLSNSANDTEKLILLDPKGNFVNEMELTTEQVQAGNYKGNPTVTSQTIKIDFKNVLKYESGISVPANQWATVYVPTFETNIPAGMYIIAVGDKGNAQYYQTTKALDVTTTGLAVDVTSKENPVLPALSLTAFKYDVVTNQDELEAAATSASEKPILLIGDIKINKIITIIGKTLVGYIDGYEVGKLILDANDKGSQPYLAATRTKFDCNVIIKAPGCCHRYGGSLRASAITLEKDRTILNENNVTFLTGYTNNIYGTINNIPFVTPDEDGFTYTAVQPEMIINKKAVVYVYGEINNEAAFDQNQSRIESKINIQSDEATGATRKDGELSVVNNGKLSNDGLIENRGTMSNQTGVASNIKNNEGATYILKIGGQLTGALLTNTSDRCDFICEVDNATDSRWNTAWSQQLANKIHIVKKQNAAYKNELDHVYAFELADGTPINNKGVQVIVENPNVYFVGSKTTGSVTEFTPVSATIGRLLVKGGAKVNINMISQRNNDATYKTIQPLKLTIDDTEWAGIECAEGAATNALNVESTANLVHNFYGLTNKDDVELIVNGNIDVNGTYSEDGVLNQTGNLNVLAEGVTTMDEDAEFATTNINVENGNDKESYGFIIKERVQGEVENGIVIASKSNLVINGDAVVNAKTVTNYGQAKWISRTGTKSPGKIMCESFSASNPSNWVNGTPINK